MKTKRQIEKEGFSVTFTNGTGAGGQKRNRTYSVAVVEHIESGIIKKSDESRSANKNMNYAYQLIVNELKSIKKNTIHELLNEGRKNAVFSRTIRTYDFKRGLVKNHLNKKEADLNKVLNGNIDLLQ